MDKEIHISIVRDAPINPNTEFIEPDFMRTLRPVATFHGIPVYANKKIPNDEVWFISNMETKVLKL